MRPCLLISLVMAAACGSGGSDGAQYEARISAARSRLSEATCACLWTQDLRTQCLENASEPLTVGGCTEQVAAEFGREQPAYASCLAHLVEQQARCVEEANCRIFASACAGDALTECGPIPEDLSPALSVCLPPFTCRTGQRLALTRRCDSVTDCFDGSDERDCP